MNEKSRSIEKIVSSLGPKSEERDSDRLMPLDENGLLILCGPSFSGKSEFARRWFKENEIISFDKVENILTSSQEELEDDPIATSMLLSIVEHRLRSNLFTVVDTRALNVMFRKRLLQLAREYQISCYLFIMDIPLEYCLQRAERSKETIEPLQLKIQSELTELASRSAYYEGFSVVYRWSSFGERGPIPLKTPLPIRLDLSGPFDIIGDIHGCYDELISLLKGMGYYHDLSSRSWVHPEGRKVIFLGDLADRGPHSLAVIELVASMVEIGNALYLPGNHCEKLARYFSGSSVSVEHGLETTVQELQLLDPPTRKAIALRFLNLYHQAPPYLLLDRDRLLVAHAGLPSKYHGRLSLQIRSFAIYGELTGELDQHGRPIRYNWALSYSGRPLVVYGHTPNLYPRFINNTINIDQGCVFGGALTALRYPERELISIPAQYIYWQP